MINSANTIGHISKEEHKVYEKNGIETQYDNITTYLDRQDSVYLGRQDTVYLDQFPEFPGGKSKMTNFIHENLNYPKKAFKDKVEGRVILSFIVDKSGDIRDIVIIKSVREDIDNEAIRLFKTMPKWLPAKKNGNPVSVRFKVPLDFKLTKL